ncbi:hypothetical protein CHS0354_009787 [Potamilus streckersoni]|uniref:Ion transport domain-containing protein n=1 Tax=Potamilus streckersoni TaxID=2493646 RepID=A0AAE0SR55_9BIVA|nr:hypothetical protein CHS0354_009787 [Potamilus streckersoni]
MSHLNPSIQNSELKLNETIFDLINRLGSSEEVDATQKLELQFQRKLSRLARYQSFKEGNKNDDCATVLHKAIATFKLSIMEQYDANGRVLECFHELSQDCTQGCFKKCAQERVLRYIITTYPELVHCHRDNSQSFCGQTPLHMAVCKQNKKLLEMLLNAARNDKKNEGGVKDLLSQKATGLRFKNNVMMAQLPLSIAVLTDNKDIVKILLEQEETDVCQENSDGDNLCHSLLKYVHMFPDREENAIEMMKFIKKENKDCCKKLFLMVNVDKETPLILAAKYGLVEVFKHIIEEGYCETDDSSGLFDVKLYDMTDIDHQLKEYRRLEDEKEKKKHLKDSAIKNLPAEKRNCAPSVFDLVFHHSYKTSLRFMQIRPIQWMIIKKWRFYRKFLYIFLLLHIIFISVLTAASVERVKSQKTRTTNQGLGAPFPFYYAIFMIIISPLYIWLGCFKLVQICRGTFQVTYKPFLNPYANAVFHVLFFLFALCIISDFGATWSTEYNNMLLITAVVIGWYLLLFFLRANSFFCFFTSLIQRILLQDITRFAPIITLQVVAFSTAMFMLLHNPNSQTTDSYSSWEGMLMLTFKSFLGVADIPISDSSHPVWLSIVFVVFVIMTTILMLNALIAIISSTCTDLLGHFTPEMHLHLQQLAVILFFEGLLPNRRTHDYAKRVTREVTVNRYDRFRNKFRNTTAHLMRIDVLEDDIMDGASVATRLDKLVKVVQDMYSRDGNSPQSSLNGPLNGTQTLQRSLKNSKSTMANTVEHLDVKRHLDIYHHPHVEQHQII